MKKSTIFLVICCCFLCSCKSFIKVTRTVTKKINLAFNINQVGNFSSTSAINGQTIASLFADNDAKFYGAKIEKVDIQSVSIGADLASGNTAQQLQLGAIIKTYLGSNTLLSDSKIIQIVSNKATDILSVVGNVTGVDDKNITLRNAIDLINSTGTQALQDALQKNLSNINSAITVVLNGKVPANQRLVMSLTIQIEATVTYSSCENSGIPFLGATEPCAI